MRGLRKRLESLASPGSILGILALCVALSGTALAHGLINSADVVNNSLRGVDVKNKSLTKKDFRGSVRGPRGLRGLPGAAGATNVVIRTGTTVEGNAANPANVTASCQAGERATGGGINVAEEEDGNVLGANAIVESYPTPTTAGATPTGWAGAAARETAGDTTATAYVICASP